MNGPLSTVLTRHPDKKFLSRGDQNVESFRFRSSEKQGRDFDERRFEHVLFGGNDPVKFGVTLIIKNYQA